MVASTRSPHALKINGGVNHPTSLSCHMDSLGQTHGDFTKLILRSITDWRSAPTSALLPASSLSISRKVRKPSPAC